jgi:hypothetical protein
VRSSLIIKGLASYVPGIYSLFRKSGTGGTNSADYCYELWLKHLTMLSNNGLKEIPEAIAELGPGDSIGLGLAALLSGANKYYALDVVKYVNTERNVLIFDELVDFFRNRKGRPAKGWPDYDHYLDANLFPSSILTEKALNRSLTKERIETIRKALLTGGMGNEEISIRYISPWNDPDIIAKESVDVIVSHSVLEHVQDLENTYKAFSLWLKPNGFMSHQMDFTSHGMSEEWNGHWSYSQLAWKILAGRRPNMINRQPCSEHIRHINRNKFQIVCLLKNYKGGGIVRSQLVPKWKNLSEDDFRCSGLFVQGQKKSED